MVDFGLAVKVRGSFTAKSLEFFRKLKAFLFETVTKNGAKWVFFEVFSQSIKINILITKRLEIR